MSDNATPEEVWNDRIKRAPERFWGGIIEGLRWLQHEGIITVNNEYGRDLLSSTTFGDLDTRPEDTDYPERVRVVTEFFKKDR